MPFEGYENEETFCLTRLFLDDRETNKLFREKAKQDGLDNLQKNIENLVCMQFENLIARLEKQTFLGNNKKQKQLINEFIVLSLKEKLDLINFKELAQQFTLE